MTGLQPGRRRRPRSPQKAIEIAHDFADPKGAFSGGSRERNGVDEG